MTLSQYIAYLQTKLDYLQGIPSTLRSEGVKSEIDSLAGELADLRWGVA